MDFGPLVHPKGRDDVAAQVEESQAQGARHRPVSMGQLRGPVRSRLWVRAAWTVNRVSSQNSNNRFEQSLRALLRFQVGWSNLEGFGTQVSIFTFSCL